MRKIKYRAWNIKSKKYVKPMTIQKMIHQQDNEFSLKELNELFVFEQFTGIKDSYGNEIYENDILFDEHYEEFGKVTFEEGSYMVHWSTYYHELIHIRNESVIIGGNIHEDKELINGEGS